MRMVFPTAEARDHVAEAYGAVEGAKQTLGRLAEHLAGRPSREARNVLEISAWTSDLEFRSRGRRAPRRPWS